MKDVSSLFYLLSYFVIVFFLIQLNLHIWNPAFLVHGDWESMAFISLVCTLYTQHPRQLTHSGVPYSSCVSYGKKTSFLQGALTTPSFAVLVPVQNFVSGCICGGLLFSCSALCILPSTYGIPSDSGLHAFSLHAAQRSHLLAAAFSGYALATMLLF